MAKFDIRITDILGAEVGRIEQFTDCEVERPYNDSRLAKFSIQLADVPQALLNPLTRYVKIRHDDPVDFWGPILNPIPDYGSGTAEVQCHDLSLFMKHHFFNIGDPPVNRKFPTNGSTLRQVIKAAMPTADEIARGVPSFPLALLGASAVIAAPDEIEVEEGAEVWATVQSMLGLNGPDFELVPIDERYDPDSLWIAGFMAQLDSYIKIGADHTLDYIFQYGFGKANLEGFSAEPDGGETVNEYTADAEGKRGWARHIDSQVARRIMAGTGSAGSAATAAEVEQAARDHVKTNAFPPDHFSITLQPNPDTPVSIGDYITAEAKRDGWYTKKSGRVTKITYRQDDPSDNVRIVLDCVPDSSAVDVDIDSGSYVTGTYDPNIDDDISYPDTTFPDAYDTNPADIADYDPIAEPFVSEPKDPASKVPKRRSPFGFGRRRPGIRRPGGLGGIGGAGSGISWEAAIELDVSSPSLDWEQSGSTFNAGTVDFSVLGPPKLKASLDGNMTHMSGLGIINLVAPDTVTWIEGTWMSGILGILPIDHRPSVDVFLTPYSVANHDFVGSPFEVHDQSGELVARLISKSSQVQIATTGEVFIQANINGAYLELGWGENGTNPVLIYFDSMWPTA